MSHYAPVISALVTLILGLILTLSKAGTIQDIPNERSLHSQPVPRTGGIALMAGILSGWMMLIQSWPWWIVLSALGMFALSLVDDMRNLSPKIRLVGHFTAALIVVLASGIAWWWMLPALLFVVWMTNLYNFMDGSDGMAGGMAFFGFSFYGIASLIHGNDNFAMMNFAIGAAALGFLYHNFHPARIFLGDCGSIPLGFLAAAFGLLGWEQGYWPFWFPLLVFSPFVADATLTLLERLKNRENLAQAHRNHYYQRLVRMGWGHKKTAVVEYILMFLAGTTALWGTSLETSVQGNLLAWWGAIYIGLSMWVDRRWRRHLAEKDDHA